MTSEWKSKEEELRSYLGNLLAIIHRDGGQHTEKVGFSQSVKEVHIAWANLMRDKDLAEHRLQTEMEKLKSVLNDVTVDDSNVVDAVVRLIEDLREEISARDEIEESERQRYIRCCRDADKLRADTTLSDLERTRSVLQARCDRYEYIPNYLAAVADITAFEEAVRADERSKLGAP